MEPYYAFAKKAFLSRSAYRFDHFMGILSMLLKVFIFWAIYRSLYGNNMEVDGITMSMVTTSFVLSIGMDAVFHVNDFYIPDRIFNGSIATELLRPVSIPGRMLSENLGNAMFQMIFYLIPVFVVSVSIVGLEAPESGIFFLLFLVSALLGYGVLWTISFMTQMLSFWMINIWSIVTIKNVFINVLSGSMIPLWFMPDWMRGILTFTPFSSIYFTPIQIYLGQLTYREIFEKYLIQILWIVIVYAIGKFLWSRGQRKLVVQGG